MMGPQEVSANPVPVIQDEMHAEIHDILGQLSGEIDPLDQELSDVIQQSQEHLLQRVTQCVNEVLQVQEQIEGVINNLTAESIEADPTPVFQARALELRATLQVLNQEGQPLILHMEASRDSLATIQGHVKKLRTTANQLKGAVRTAPPKQRDNGSQQIIGATNGFLSKWVASSNVK